MADLNNVPQIVTLDNLKDFKDSMLDSIGATLGNKQSLVQPENDSIKNNVSHSAFFGESHAILPVNNKNLKNVLVSGFSNIAADWNQTVLGTFNKPVKDALFVVGNGTSDFTRNNTFEIFKDNTVTINGVAFRKINSDQLAIDGKLTYYEGGLLNGVDSWAGINKHINSLQDNELITADIAKELAKIIDLADFDDEAIKTWRDELIETLTLDPSDINSYNNFRNKYFTPEALSVLDKKALSVADGQYLLSLINQNKDDAKVAELANMITTLRKQVSYLISCLTVDKISNAAYKADDEDLIEYYAVGIADYALDADTPFEILNKNVKKETY